MHTDTAISLGDIVKEEQFKGKEEETTMNEKQGVGLQCIYPKCTITVPCCFLSVQSCQ